MSVSGWETRSMASARGAADHYQYQHQHQHHRHSLHGARQFDGGSPYPPNNTYRPSDVPPRHYSFAQPPKQYEHPPQQPGRRTEMRQRRQSVATGGLPSRAELVRLHQQQQQQPHHNQPMMWEPERQQYPRERMSMPHTPSFRQEQVYHQQQPPRRESNTTGRSTQDQRRDPPRQEQPYQRHSEHHYKQQPQIRQYTEQQYSHHTQQQREEAQYDQHPPQRRPSVPQYQRLHGVHTAAPPIPEEPQVNLDDALLDKRWKVQIVSYLYQFQRAELGDYANELVKFLRGHAVMSYEQEFGYSVIIRFNADCVVFQIVEARDLHAEFLVEKMEQPQRPETVELINPRELEERHRTGSIAVFFPRSAENPTTDPVRRNRKNGLEPHRFSNGSRSNHNGSEHSNSSSTGSHQYRRDAKFPFLVRGNEELMTWVTSWLQRRFQCSIGKYAVQVTADNLRRVARNWVIESLEREARVVKAVVRNAERVRKASGLGGVGVGDELSLPTVMDTRAPVLLKYRTPRASDAVKAFTVTMPWASVRRFYAKMHGGVSSALGSVPEVLDRVEKEYFGHVAKDLAAMELIGFHMEEVEVDTEGTVKFYKSTMIQSILQSYLDTLAVQLVSNAADGETTF